MNTSETLLGKEIPLTIERMAYGGDGLGHYQGKAIFVPFSAPEDRLQAKVVEDHIRYARAQLIKIDEASLKRSEPRCPIFGKCGGCHWQHIDYPSQANYKQEIFKEALVHVGGIKDPVVEPILLAASPWEYRERIQIKVDKNQRYGFYERGSHLIVPFDSCFIAHPEINRALSEQRFVTNCELIFDHQTEQVVTRLDEVTYRHFSQVHPTQNKKLIETVLEYAEPLSHELVLELYAGQGNLSFALAPHVASLIAVDQDQEMIKRGGRKMQSQNISNIKFIAGTAEWGLKRVMRREQRVDTLILDPPRQGAKEIIDLISVLKPGKIVYVSCNPTSLARDIKFLREKGYDLTKTRPIDMFPQTYHIEAVAQLTHRLYKNNIFYFNKL